MSMEATDIWCEACDFRSSSGRVWGYFIYRFGSPNRLETNVEREAGWCQHCANIEAIEDLTARDRLAKELEQELAKLQRISRSLLYRLFGIGKDQVNRVRAGIRRNEEDLRVLKLMLQRRTAPPRCLRCGSIAVAPIDLPDPQVGEVLNLKIRHPGCGGKLLARMSSVRLNMRYPQRIYDGEGNFIGAERSR
jgi:hypothetical protein